MAKVNDLDRKIVASALNTAYGLIGLDTNIKTKILKYYVFLYRGAKYDPMLDNFNILLSRAVVNALYYEKNSAYFKEALKDCPELQRIFNTNNKMLVIVDAITKNTFSNNVRYKDTINLAKIIDAANLSEVHVKNVLEANAAKVATEIEENLEKEEGDFSEFSEFISENNEEANVDTNNEASSSDAEIDSWTEEDEIEQAFNKANAVSPELAEELASENSENSNSLEDFESARKILNGEYGQTIMGCVNNILTCYETLYKSAYSPVRLGGILTEGGFIKSASESNGGGESYDEMAYDNPVLDSRIVFMQDKHHSKEFGNRIMRAIQSATGDAFNTSSLRRPGALPNIKDILTARQHGQIIMYPGIHLRAMFGHFNFCLGRNYGLRHFCTEKGLTKYDNRTKVVSWSDMSKYLKFYLEYIVYKAFYDMGMHKDKILHSEERFGLADEIKEALEQSLMQIVTVAEYTGGTNAKVRVKVANGADSNAILSALEKMFNAGSVKTYNIQTLDMGSGVLEFNIIQNVKAFQQADLYAWEVLETLKEQQMVPDWSNILLGQDDKGLKTLNLNSSTKSCVGMYGAKGSGKGVMTLNLLCAALSDGAEVLYADAKPDSAEALVEVAWKNGVDAAVINGLQTGQSLEKKFKDICIRELGDKNNRGIGDPYRKEADVPNKLFNSAQDKQTFITVTEYYRTLDLYIKYCEHRFKTENTSRRLVAVFDEVEALTASEVSMMQNFENNKKAYEKTLNKEQKADDPVLKFYNNYMSWRKSLQANLENAIRATFRKACCTTIFIWQTSAFPGNRRSTSILGAGIFQQSSDMIKLVGKGGMIGGGTDAFGNSTVMKEATWYDSRFTELGGYWAIGENVRNLEVFKPYKVFANTRGKELIINDALSAGLTKEDLIGKSLTEDGEVIPGVGFEGYATELLSIKGMTPAQQLNIGFKALDDFARNELGSEGFLGYVYDVGAMSDVEIGAIERDYESTDEDINSCSEALSDGDFYKQASGGNTYADPEEVAKATADMNTKIKQAIENRNNTEQSAREAQNTNMHNGNAPDIFGNVMVDTSVHNIENGQATAQEMNNFQTGGFDNAFNSEGGHTAFSNKQVTAPINQQNTNIRIDARKPIPCNTFFKLAEDNKKSHLNRALRELPREYNLNITSNTMFGLKHLCWNISILLSQGMLNTQPVSNNIRSFVINYANLIQQGTYQLDYIPSQDEVDELNCASDEDPVAFNNFGNGAMASSNDFIPSSDTSLTAEAAAELNEAYAKIIDSGINGSISGFSRSPQGDLVIENFEAIPAESVKQIPKDAQIVIPTLNEKGLKAKLFPFTTKGQGYMLTNRMDELMRRLEKQFPDRGSVLRAQIGEQTLTVMGRMVNVSGLISEEYGIDFKDFMDIPRLLKKYKNLQELNVDYTMFISLVDYYGATVQDIYKIFQENPNLKYLRAQLDPSQNVLEVISRETYKDVSVRQKIANSSDKAVLKEAIDAVAYRNDNRSAERGFGYKLKASSDSALSKSQQYVKLAEQCFMNTEKHQGGRALMYAGAWALTGMVGLSTKLLSAPRRMMDLLKI